MSATSWSCALTGRRSWRATTFPLDRFQIEAFDALDDGRHVVVAAPTGSGKTVVAEYGIELARRRGARAFYTAPIKALSNQKYRDLVEIHGESEVGLLTGDNSINGDAPVVVMTTEVLRNMIYGGKQRLDDLGVVVLDEVHFLQDAYRGPVWEEVIIHLPRHVQLVCLSATVSNARELAEWIGTVRGPTDAVIEERRPVRLDNFYFVGDRTNDRLHLLPTFVDAPSEPRCRCDSTRRAVRFGRGRPNERGLRGSGRRKLYTPGRVETVELLDSRGMLPAIYFIFSRNQCDEAARACRRRRAAAHRPRTSATASAQIADARLGALDPADLAVLGYATVPGPARGRARAPPRRDGAAVQGGRRSVLRRGAREGGVRHRDARGRDQHAGSQRRDREAHEVHRRPPRAADARPVHPAHRPGGPSGHRRARARGGARGARSCASSRSPSSPAARRSTCVRRSGRPTTWPPTWCAPTATRTPTTCSTCRSRSSRPTATSCASRRRLERQRTGWPSCARRRTSPFGDIDEYRQAIEQAREPRGRDDPIELAMLQLRPGTVVHVSKGKYHGPAAVVASAHRKGGLRLTTITAGGDSIQLDGRRLRDAAAAARRRWRCPTPYAPNRHDYRARGRAAGQERQARTDGERRRPGVEGGAAGVRHPVGHASRRGRSRPPGTDPRRRPGRPCRARDRRARDAGSSATTSRWRREFDGVLAVLSDVRLRRPRRRGRSPRRGRCWPGRSTRSICWSPSVCGSGCSTASTPAELAGLVSTFVYEHRAPDDPPRPWFPSDGIKRRWRSIAAVSEDLAAIERSHGLAEHRPPEPTFFAVAYAWVAGDSFAEVVADEELTGGDFVRTVKQLIDLLGQIATVAPDPDTRRAARQAADAASAASSPIRRHRQRWSDR